VTARGTASPELLATLDALLVRHDDALDLRFARACMLEDLGRTAAAARAYDDLLARDRTHRGALINAGTLAFVDGDTMTARALYARAVAAHPDDPAGHVNLGHVLADAGEIDAARACYERALVLEPQHAIAHYAFARLLDACGDHAAARGHRTRAFATPITSTTACAHRAPVRVLMPIAADGGNLVSTLFFDDRTVETTTLIAESYDPHHPLPAHDLIVNAVADADRSGGALDAVERIIAASDRPCINPPAAIRATGRAAIAARLRDIPGVVVPRIARVARANCTSDALTAAGFTFPLLLRAPGFHAGRHFVYVATPDDLEAQRTRVPGDDVFAIDFIDTRRDGAYEKYRLLIIDGQLFPLHLAIASQWNVHYFGSRNAHDAIARAREAAFLAAPRAHLGSRATRALETIRDRLGLDYGGIDFGFDAVGNVVVFEANASFAIYYPDEDATATYRRPLVDAAVGAVRAMIASRATPRADAETPLAR
jgi:glutathione synthase/RimK-type ligase-like ATP-grasp enzyme